MNREQRLNWEKTRAKGRLRYVLLHGVLGFGVHMLFVMGGLELFVSDGKVESDEWIFKSVLFLGGGAVIGVLQWMNNESKYARSE